MDSRGDTHSELFASLVAGTFSKLHVRLSQQLARSNPELTLPMFSGKWEGRRGGKRREEMEGGEG